MIDSVTPAAAAQPVELVALGGLGEFGLNMMAISMGDTILIVDVGLMFPESGLLGVDLVIPDMSYLQRNRERVRGVVLTHGHEDHIGAVPYLLRQMSVPVYGSRLALEMCRRRLEEHGLAASADLRPVEAGSTFEVGDLSISPLHVSHSVADSLALVIETPHGPIVHTGDFKLDQTPIVGEPTDVHRFAEVGRRGVLALLSDSTNAEVAGYTGSERDVAQAFHDVFSRATARIFVCCFTSSTHRIQLTFDLARRYGRKVALLGRSMTENVETAMDLGFLQVPAGVLIRPADVRNTPPDRVVLLTAGSQGEPLSALAQIAVDQHKHVHIEPGDVVIHSARVIPGNERLVSRVVSHLYRRGAEVFHAAAARVHVSGHASAEELKLMLNLVRPRYVVPIHGEWRQLVAHSRLAEQVGITRDRILLAEDGDVVSFNGEGGRIAGKEQTGRVFVDGSGMGDVSDIVLRDRQHLSEGGIVIPVVAINKQTGRADAPPEIIIRGFFADDDLLAEASGVVKATIEGSSTEEVTDSGLIREKIQTALRKFFRKRIQRRPMILPVVMET
jgi:ribonuclease J